MCWVFGVVVIVVVLVFVLAGDVFLQPKEIGKRIARQMKEFLVIINFSSQLIPYLPAGFQRFLIFKTGPTNPTFGVAK